MRLRPLFSFLATFCLGVCASSLLPLGFLFWLLLATVACVIGVCLFKSRPYTALFCLLLMGFCLGIGRAKQVQTPLPDDISRSLRQYGWVAGRVASAVEPGKSGGFRYVITVDDHRSGLLSVFQSQGVEPHFGGRVAVRGVVETPPSATNLGEFDYKESLARHGIVVTLRTKSSADMKVIEGNRDPFSGTITFLRTAVQRATRAHLSPQDAALMEGLLLSTRTNLTVEEQNAFQVTGTVHVLSVSGLHLAALAMVLHWLLRKKLALPRVVCALCTLLILWPYALAAGGGPAVLRSAVMSSMFLLAPLLRRRAEPLHTLAFAALMIFLFEPLALFDPGTQLTFMTVGLLLLYIPVIERVLPFDMPKFRRSALIALGAGLVASFGSAPLVAYHFHLVSVIAPLANMPIALLSEGLLLGGLLGVLLSPMPLIGPLFWGILGGGVMLLRTLTLLFAQIPLAAYSAVSPPIWVLVFWYTGLWILSRYAHKNLLNSYLFAPITPITPRSPATL
jgi:competence protein ComEC